MEWYSPVDNIETKDTFNYDKSGLNIHGTKTHSPLLTFSQYRQRQLSKSHTHDNTNPLNTDNPYSNSRFYNTDKSFGDYGNLHTSKFQSNLKEDYPFNGGVNKFSSHDNTTSYLNGSDYPLLSPVKQSGYRPYYNTNYGDLYRSSYDSSYRSNHPPDYKSSLYDYRPTSDFKTSDYGYKCSYNNYKPSGFDYRHCHHDDYKSPYDKSNDDYVNYIPAYDAKMSKITKIPMYNNVTVPSFPKYTSQNLNDSFEHTSPIYKRKTSSTHYQYKSPSNNFGYGSYSSRYNDNETNANWTGNNFTSYANLGNNYTNNPNSTGNRFGNFKYNPNTPGSDSIKNSNSDTRLFTSSPVKYERSERREILKSNDSIIGDNKLNAKRHKSSSSLFDNTPNRNARSNVYFNHENTKYISPPFDFDNVGLFDNTPKRNRSLLSTPVKPWN